MSYRMNIANELAQAKYCKTLEDLEKFCKEHNFHCTDAAIYEDNFPRVKGFYLDKDVQVTFEVQSRF